MTSRRVLVTGSTDGIGKAAATILAAAGWQVLIHGRDLRGAEAACRQIRTIPGVEPGSVEPVAADFAVLAEVADLASALARDRPPDAVVHNAGLLTPNDLADRRRLSADGLELHWAVNHLAPFVLTTTLLAAPNPPRRIVSVVSGMRASDGIVWDDTQLAGRWDRFTAYAQSKLALLMTTQEVAEGFAARVSAASVSPGYVDTKLVRAALGGPALPVEEGGRVVARLLLHPAVRDATAVLFDREDAVELPADAADPQARRRLWELSAAQIGVVRGARAANVAASSV